MNQKYINGPWVLLDEHQAVVDIVDTVAAVGQFITEREAAGLDYDIDTLEFRCEHCGEYTALDDPHAPQCPIELGVDPTTGELTLRGLLDHFTDHLGVYRSTDEEEANTSGKEIADLAERLLKRVALRAVDDITTGVTIDGVDVHVRTDGDTTTVSVGAEEAPPGQQVVIQDWTGTTWEHAVTPQSDAHQRAAGGAGAPDAVVPLTDAVQRYPGYIPLARLAEVLRDEAHMPVEYITPLMNKIRNAAHTPAGRHVPNGFEGQGPLVWCDSHGYRRSGTECITCIGDIEYGFPTTRAMKECRLDGPQCPDCPGCPPF